MYDFSKVAPATVGNYIEPGLYKLRIKEAKGVESKQNKTPGIAVTFENKEKQTVTATFYVTENTLDRLQYLHNAWLGKNVDGKFKTPEDIIEYFVKALTSTAAKKTIKPVVVGGNIAENGKVFSDLPYSGFVLESEDDVEFGPFDTDSKEYKKYVTASTLKNEASGKKNGILNDDDDDDNDTDEEETKKKPAGKGKAAATKPAAKAGKGKKEEPEEEEAGGDDDDDAEEKDDLNW